jgi:hypothetical protein
MGLVILFVMILLVYDLKPEEKGGTPEDSKAQGIEDSKIQSSRLVPFKRLERA